MIAFIKNSNYRRKVKVEEEKNVHTCLQSYKAIQFDTEKLNLLSNAEKPVGGTGA